MRSNDFRALSSSSRSRDTRRAICAISDGLSPSGLVEPCGEPHPGQVRRGGRWEDGSPSAAAAVLTFGVAVALQCLRVLFPIAYSYRERSGLATTTLLLVVVFATPVLAVPLTRLVRGHRAVLVTAAAPGVARVLVQVLSPVPVGVAAVAIAIGSPTDATGDGARESREVARHSFGPFAPVRAALAQAYSRPSQRSRPCRAVLRENLDQHGENMATGATRRGVILLIGIAVLVGVAAPAAASSASGWAKTFCNGQKKFRTALKAANDESTAASRELSQTRDVVPLKTALDNGFTSTRQEADSIVRSLKKVGAPDITNGKKLHKAALTTYTTVGTQLQTGQDALATVVAADPASLDALSSAARALGDAASTDGGFSLGVLYDTMKKNQSFASAVVKSCTS